MPWFYLIVIAMLGSYMMYSLDQINKMAYDLKYVRSKMN
jgi:hypothetical protein